MNEALMCTQAWLNTFRKAGRALQTPRPLIDDLDRSKRYLEQALVIFMQHQDSWNDPPFGLYPPEFPDDGVDVFDDVRAGVPMVNRRLLIRLVTLQSEILACEATQCRYGDPPQWLEGVEHYENSLERLHFAMQLADSEFARLVQENENAVSVMSEDASIVQVANGSLIQQRDKYRRAATAAAQKIRTRLEPQWKSRDEVKNKMGNSWYENPNPKKDHWHMREADEIALKEIEAAIQRLDALFIPEFQISQASQMDASQNYDDDGFAQIDSFNQNSQRFEHYH